MEKNQFPHSRSLSISVSLSPNTFAFHSRRISFPVLYWGVEQISRIFCVPLPWQRYLLRCYVSSIHRIRCSSFPFFCHSATAAAAVAEMVLCLVACMRAAINVVAGHKALLLCESSRWNVKINGVVKQSSDGLYGTYVLRISGSVRSACASVSEWMAIAIDAECVTVLNSKYCVELKLKSQCSVSSTRDFVWGIWFFHFVLSVAHRFVRMNLKWSRKMKVNIFLMEKICFEWDYSPWADWKK